jgi:tetratricopeptide (TPR) repeat protein
MTDWQERELGTAGNLVQQGSQALRKGQIQVAHGAFSEALAVLDMSPSSPDGELELKAQIYNELGVLHQRKDAPQEARDYHEQSLDICETLLERDVDFRSNAAATYLNLSSVLAASGDIVEAKKLSERAIELITSVRDDGDETINSLAVGAYQNMSLLYSRNERFDEAADEMDKALEIVREMGENGNQNGLPQAAQACQRLSVKLFEAGKHDAALEWGEKAENFSEDAYEAIGQDALSIYVVSQINLISYNEQLSHFADAEDALWKGLEVSGNHTDILHRGVAFYDNARKQADARLERGNLPRDEVEEGSKDLQKIIDEMGGLPEVEGD